MRRSLESSRFVVTLNGYDELYKAMVYMKAKRTRSDIAYLALGMAVIVPEGIWSGTTEYGAEIPKLQNKVGYVLLDIDTRIIKPYIADIAQQRNGLP